MCQLSLLALQYQRKGGEVKQKSRKSKFWKSDQTKSKDSSKGHNRQEDIPKAVPVEPRQDDWSFPAGSKVPAITKALNAYVMSQGAQDTPDCRKVAIHQTDVSRAFFKEDIKEQSPKDDLADQEKNERHNSTLATIQEVAEPRGKRSADGIHEKDRYAKQKMKRVGKIPLSLLF